MSAETIPDRIERIKRDHNVGFTTAHWIARAEIRIEEHKAERAAAITERCETCTEYTDLCDCPTDGCPQEQWEVTTPAAVYATSQEEM